MYYMESIATSELTNAGISLDFPVHNTINVKNMHQWFERVSELQAFKNVKKVIKL